MPLSPAISIASRLQRLEYLLHCVDSSLPARLADLLHSLAALTAHHPPINALFQLYHNNPALFRPQNPASELSLEEKAHVVLACAPKFHDLASRLLALKDTPLPDLPSLAPSLPLVARLSDTLSHQQSDVAVLALRTAKLLELWFTTLVQDLNSQFLSYSSRINNIDKALKKLEMEDHA